MKTINTQHWYTTVEVARKLHMLPDTVRKYCQRRVIAGQKVGRDWLIHQADMERYAAESRKK